MRSPSHASFRVAARAHRMVLRVSQSASRRTSLRSRSKQSACTVLSRNQGQHSCPHPGHRYHVSATISPRLLAANLPRCLRSSS